VGQKGAGKHITAKAHKMLVEKWNRQESALGVEGGGPLEEELAFEAEISPITDPDKVLGGAKTKPETALTSAKPKPAPMPGPKQEKYSYPRQQRAEVSAEKQLKKPVERANNPKRTPSQGYYGGAGATSSSYMGSTDAYGTKKDKKKKHVKRHK
jgi:hypothetical protein